MTWEKSNPLKLEDKGVLQARIVYTFKSALLHLRHYPEIWYAMDPHDGLVAPWFALTLKELCRYNAVQYLVDAGKSTEAEEMLKQGAEAIPASYVCQ